MSKQNGRLCIASRHDKPRNERPILLDTCAMHFGSWNSTAHAKSAPSEAVADALCASETIFCVTDHRIGNRHTRREGPRSSRNSRRSDGFAYVCRCRNRLAEMPPEILDRVRWYLPGNYATAIPVTASSPPRRANIGYTVHDARPRTARLCRGGLSKRACMLSLSPHAQACEFRHFLRHRAARPSKFISLF